MTGYTCVVYNSWFFCSKTARRKGSVLKLMFWCRRFRYCWKIFSWWRRYCTINVTMMLGFFASIWIQRRRVWCFSITEILLTLTIFCVLLKWPLLLFPILICVTGYFLWTPIGFWIIFRRPVWLAVYKHTKMNVQ